MQTLILKAYPAVHPCRTEDGPWYDGNNGHLYNVRDIPALTMQYGAPKQRKTKYGVSLYFSIQGK